MASRRSRNFSYTPRSIRRQEKKTRRVLIWSIIFVVALLFFFVTQGLPLTIKLFSKFNQKSTPQALNGYAELTPPVFNIPYEATGSAEVIVAGYSQPDTMVAIYLNNEKQVEVATKEDGTFSSSAIELIQGENYLYGQTVDTKGQTSLNSKTIKITYDGEKPKLEINEPEDNKIIQGGDKKVTVRGKTDPENSVTINGLVTIVNGDGSFQREYSLSEGENIIIIKATNLVGNSSESTKKVTFNP